MILLDMKSSKTSSSPLALTASKDKPLLSFSDLLRGAGQMKEGKTIQNGSLVLALDAKESDMKSVKTLLKTDDTTLKQRSLTKEDSSSLTSKKDHLSLLLNKGDKLSLDEEREFLELNQKLTANLTSVEMKALVNDAKNYLKEMIQNSDGYKKSEIKDLPKTLGGLIEVAKKLGIDIGKISIEEVKKYFSNETSPKEATQDRKTQSTSDKQNSESQSTAKAEPTTEIKSDLTPKETTQDKKAPNISDKQSSESQYVAKAELTTEIKSDLIPKETLLFKAHMPSEHATTEQIVQTKANNLTKTDQKNSKDRSDEALKTLLSDEKSLQKTDSIGIEPSKTASQVVTHEITKTLEQLLGGETVVGEQNQQTSKIEAFNAHKSESLEVKINEAKQMIRYLSDDIKNAIDEYKSPFTRIKVQLNPQHLGEVDLTIVQRGKNLHVNLSSNNTAINALAMNANELRVQLNNSGINNATLNFSDSSQQGGYTDGGSNGSEQQKRQNEQKAHTEYSYFKNEEAHEEILSSLEIIVPRYI